MNGILLERGKKLSIEGKVRVSLGMGWCEEVNVWLFISMEIFDIEGIVFRIIRVMIERYGKNKVRKWFGFGGKR